MNSSQLEFRSLNTFLHPGRFYLSVSPPWLLQFNAFLCFCSHLKEIQYFLLPQINSQMKMENSRHVCSLCNVLSIVSGMDYNKACHYLQRILIFIFFPPDVSVLRVFLLKAMILLFLFGLAEMKRKDQPMCGT